MPGENRSTRGEGGPVVTHITTYEDKMNGDDAPVLRHWFLPDTTHQDDPGLPSTLCFNFQNLIS